MKLKQETLFDLVIKNNSKKHTDIVNYGILDDEAQGIGEIDLLSITLDEHITEVEEIALIRWYHKRSWAQIRDLDLIVTQKRLNELCLLEAYEAAVIQLLRSDIEGLRWRTKMSDDFSAELPRKFIKRTFGLGEYQVARVIKAIVK